MSPSKHSSSTASRRLSLTRSHLSSTATSDHDPDSSSSSQIPKWNPNWNHFPARHALPPIPNAPAGAAWFWGPNDNLGRLNLLTPKRVLAAKQEIRTGELVNLDMQLGEPAVPAFGRQAFRHEILAKKGGTGFDDVWELNPQSGTQWDGFRHFSHRASTLFYNNTTAAQIHGPAADPSKCSIHHWSSSHGGIAARALLLDYHGFALARGIKYDPYTHHEISLADLHACARWQRVDIRPASAGGQVRIGDVLLIRTGFVSAYRALAPGRAAELAQRKGDEVEYAGVQQSWEVVDWLHDCYFAAVGGDAPAFEAWPSRNKEVGFLHEWLLALWGVPLGEMLDLDVLADKCRERKSWFFFFTSSPANVVGGVASHVNGMAIL